MRGWRLRCPRFSCLTPPELVALMSTMRPLGWLTLLVLVLVSRTSRATDDSAYVEALVGRAAKARLAEDPQWLRLVHYRRRTFGGYRSEADGKLFFLAPDGKTDPSRELEATLRGFFGPGPEDPEHQHPICRFPARLLWLAGRLDLDRSRLPQVPCERLREFVEQLNPAGVTVVFSSYYMGSPASAFGHTFLRINKRRNPLSGKAPELLDYGIDYSAQVDSDNFIVYAFKGILGLFPGTFRRVPYYLKVREYNDYESRDLWEYELDLEPKEVAVLALHLWELGSTHFDYYYLDENCSYHILGVIEAGRPSAELTRGLGWPVIPAETVKALYRESLVRSVVYRPSAHVQFTHRVAGLDGDEMALLTGLVGSPEVALNSLAVERQVAVLDAALDLADSTYAQELLKEGDDRDQDVADYKQRLLERRAAILLPSEDFSIVPPVRRMPHLSHGSQRWALGSGYDSGPGFFHSLRYRLALHDLADPASGYPEMAQVEFLPIEIRYDVEGVRPWFESAMLIDIVSLSPFTRFDKGLSWTVRTGASRVRDAGCEPSCVTGLAEASGGIALGAFSDGAVFFLNGGLQVRGLGPIAGGIADLPLRAGVGGIGGLRLRFTDDFITVAKGRWFYLPVQAPWHTWEVDVAARYQYAKNFAFGVEGSHHPAAYTLQASSYLYF
jgi:hypothetical protein